MRFLFHALVILAVAPLAAAEPASSYAGQEKRQIKALSPAHIEGLLAGKGLGFGKSAELNRYPGPAHVLELADELDLSESQLRATRAVHARMEEQARELGTRLVAAEAELERSFREDTATESSLRSALVQIGQLQGELRAVHLVAHLEQRRLLSPDQVTRYVQLRGYHGSHQTGGSGR